MKSSRCILLLASLIAGTLSAQDAQVTPLMSKDLADFPGKEGLMITVVYPPGASDPIHRHNAHAFVYVLEGSIVMQVKGRKEITLTPGQSFYEGPNDIHTVGRNASTTKPAKFIVLLIKDKGAPVLVPVNPASASVPSPKLNAGEEQRPQLESRTAQTIYYKDWGEVLLRVSHVRPLDSGAWDRPMLFLAQNRFRVGAFWRRSKGARSYLSSYARQIALYPLVCQG